MNKIFIIRGRRGKGMLKKPRQGDQKAGEYGSVINGKREQKKEQLSKRGKFQVGEVV